MTKIKTSSTPRRASRSASNPPGRRVSLRLAALALLALSATTASAQVLTVGKTRMTVANAVSWPKSLGVLKMEAVLSDGDNGNFVNDMLANAATISITDAGSYAITDLAISGCISRKGGVKCTSDSAGFRVRFVGVQHRNYPDVYRLTLRIRDLTDAETGTGPLAAPISVVFDQTPSLSRTDQQPTSECIERAGGNALRCKADN